MRSQRSYQREIARLKRLVSDAEWVQPTYNGSPSCAFCGNQQHWNHAVDCPLPKPLRSKMERNASGEWVRS
jgi:hypothetical protein